MAAEALTQFSVGILLALRYSERLLVSWRTLTVHGGRDITVVRAGNGKQGFHFVLAFWCQER